MLLKAVRINTDRAGSKYEGNTTASKQGHWPIVNMWWPSSFFTSIPLSPAHDYPFALSNPLTPFSLPTLSPTPFPSPVKLQSKIFTSETNSKFKHL